MLLHDLSNIELMEAARDALTIIKADKETKPKNLLEEVKETWTSATLAQSLFEEYDEAAFEQKAKVDVLFYEQLLQKLDEQYGDYAHKALSSLFGVVRDIYEFINIRPETYGSGINFDILEDSEEQIKQKLSNVIYDTLDVHFYSLSTEDRKNRYLEESRELSKQLINEGAEASEAIQFAVKTAVMENLLRNISFPFSVYSRITTLMESTDYAEIFDQDKLIDLVNSFETKIFEISKIVSSVV